MASCSSLGTETALDAPESTTAAPDVSTTEAEMLFDNSIHQLDVSYPFRGDHQQGVTAPAAPSGVVMGVDVLAQDREELGKVLQGLTGQIEQIMANSDQGVSVVVGFGDSLFDDRFGLASQKPTELQPMPTFANDSLIDPESSHGDMSLIVNGAAPDVVDQAVQQIFDASGGALQIRWSEIGHNEILPEAGYREAPVRNLLGFKDGTVNLSPDNDEVMDGLVWVAAIDQQPEWALGGTYQALRVIAMFLDPWNQTSVDEQETIIGRERESGAPLGGLNETDDPYFFDLDFASHIGRVNPRVRGINPILRRGFNYVRDNDESSDFDQGLVFVSYQRSLVGGFIGMQQRLDGEGLEQFVRPIHGGLFFVPPPPAEGEYLGQRLIES